MQAALEDFFRALRSADVRVSPAEAIDAHRALMEIGFSDRQLVKDTLCIALAKTEDEVDRFDSCFDAYFTRDEFRTEEQGETVRAPSQGGAPSEDLPLAQMLLAGDIGDGSIVKIGAARGRLTINGKPVGTETEEGASSKPPTIVPFPKS